MSVETEQVTVEIEGFEGGRHGDGRGTAIEYLANKTRGVSAEDLEPFATSIAVPLGDVDELITAQRQHPVETGQREKDIEDGVVGHPHFMFAFVEEVAQHGAVERDP